TAPSSSRENLFASLKNFIGVPSKDTFRFFSTSQRLERWRFPCRVPLCLAFDEAIWPLNWGRSWAALVRFWTLENFME
ncbi:MAG: hypothetical protein KJ943_12655, partial [Alphaproteobacteria bacterium]|nr:hypothetical protein [Alphaproteobacteria bacterium]